MPPLLPITPPSPQPPQPPPPSPVIAPADFCRRFVNAASAEGFDIVEFGTAGDFPLLAATRSPATGAAPELAFYLSAGIHGDEPAGPLALLELLRQHWFDPQITWHLLPLLNPLGIAAGTRENADALDLNRDYHALRSAEVRAHCEWLRRTAARFDAAFSLHEDWGATGFYLYEMRTAPRTHGEPELGRAILQTLEPFTGIDRSPEIDGFPASNGLLVPCAADSLANERDWPEQLLLARDHTTLSLTFETPSALPLPTRILAQTVAIKTAVNLLLAPKISDCYEI